MSYFWLLLAWAGFGLLHSLTASFPVKAWAAKQMGSMFRYYRLLYNGLAVLTFGGLLFLHGRYTGEPLWASFLGQGFIASGIQITGMVIVLLALRGYDLHEFLGLDGFQPARKGEQFRQNGLLRYVRHPLYLGTILFTVGLFLTEPSPGRLILLVGAITYIRIGIHFEERKLVREFGEEYRTYRKRVPMLLPRPSRSSMSRPEERSENPRAIGKEVR